MRQHRVAPLICLAIAFALVCAPVAYAEGDDTGGTDPTTTPITTPTTTPVAATPNPAPVIVVRSYTTSASRLLVGAPFDLSVTVYNATARRADNVVVSLGAATSGSSGSDTTPASLTVLGTGNAKFLGNLKGQSEAAITFQVVAGPSTTPGALSVPVTVSFEHQGTRQDVTYYIGLLLERDAALSLVTAELPDSVLMGEPFEASFEIANASAFALSGVTLSVEASGAQVTDSSLFLGSFDAAGSEAIDVTISPETAGPLEVSVVVSYRDDYGRVQVFKETRIVQVEEAPELGPEQEGPAQEVKSDNWFVKFIKSLFGLG